MRAHYFEDGNVQLQSKKAVPESTLSYADPAALGKAVAEAIKEAEGSLQQGLEEMYLNMSEETFKAMRRVMPITRTKMKWSLAEVNLNKNLTKK